METETLSKEKAEVATIIIATWLTNMCLCGKMHNGINLFLLQNEFHQIWWADIALQSDNQDKSDSAIGDGFMWEMLGVGREATRKEAYEYRNPRN